MLKIKKLIKYLITIIIIALLLGGGLYWYTRFKLNNQNTNNFATFTVKNGPLIIGVTESGTIMSREQVIIKSEVEGKASILRLIPEGTEVKKGDLLIELDASQLLDGKVDQQIRVQNAEAAYISARENLEVVKSQAQSDVDNAELTLDFAKQDLDKYLQGEYPNALKEAEARITLAQEEISRAAEKVNWSKKLFAQKYISQTELDADELAVKSKSLDLELAKNNLDLLTKFTYKKKLAELESGVKQAGSALERTNRKTKSDIVQAESELTAKKSEYGRQQDKLAKTEKQIEKTKIYTPADGLVIYATSAKAAGRMSRVEPLSEGQTVQEQQELIYLSTSSAVKAKIGIHEASLRKIKEGIEVKVTVDALPGKTFSGHITSIAPLPDASSAWMNPDLKIYNAEVYLDGDGKFLRSGMSCRAEILIAQYDNATYIPLQAVTRIGGEATVYVVTGKTFKPQKVEIGLDDNKMIQIINGLQPGELVLLAPPLGTETASTSPYKPGRPGNREKPEDIGDKTFLEKSPVSDFPNNRDSASSTPKELPEKSNEAGQGKFRRQPKGNRQ